MIMSGSSCSAEGRGGFINEEVNEDEMKVFPFELAGKISDNTQHTREKIKGDVPKITVFRFYIITEALSVISLSAANDKQFFAQILQPFLLTQQQQQQQTKNKKQKGNGGHLTISAPPPLLHGGHCKVPTAPKG